MTAARIEIMVMAVTFRQVTKWILFFFLGFSAAVGWATTDSELQIGGYQKTRYRDLEKKAATNPELKIGGYSLISVNKTGATATISFIKRNSPIVHQKLHSRLRQPYCLPPMQRLLSTAI
jgi:hypothetical protein